MSETAQVFTKQGVGRFNLAARGKTGLVYIPAELVRDSTFPFTNGELIEIKVTKNGLSAEKR
jgi:hypothetical protein